MARKLRHLLLAVLAAIALGLSACVPPAAQQPAAQTPAPTPAVAAASAAPEPTATLAAVPTVAATPTPRPTPSAPATTATPTSQIQVTLALPTPVRPPDRDPVDLARRLKPGPIVVATPQAPPSYKVGDRHTFWVLDQTTKAFYQVSARIVYLTDHLYMYVADGVDLPLGQVKASADLFERQTYPTLRRYFGSEWSPGVDNDVHITILNARIPGVGGYFSSSDEYPRSVNEYSNEREMVYMNTDSARPGTPGYDSTLAHEFTHMIQFNTVRGGETWINEGSAELGAKAAGQGGTGSSRIFLDSPDLQLTDWAESPSQAIAHYGAAFLFLDYFAEHYGGYEAVGKLLAEGARGDASFDAYLARRGLSLTFDDIFKDWVVANYLDDQQVDGGRYGYQAPSVRARAQVVDTYPARRSASVQQYGADYYQLQNLQGNVVVSFAGQKEGQLTCCDPRSGRAEWWSNRGDSIDSRLTRRLDLTGLQKATLQFWVWYDVEENYDYAFVEVSTDGGQTWKTLPGRHTTTSNPNGGNYGNGFTGRSGGGGEARWVQEQMDLTPYAGRQVLLRFEYVTDDAYNAEGIGLDDIVIPELGFRDDAEADAGWDAQGFVRIDNRVAERYAVQVISLGRAREVRSLPLDADDRGQLTFQNVGPGRDVEQLVVVVAGLTPLTTRPSRYDLTVTSGGP